MNVILLALLTGLLRAANGSGYIKRAYESLLLTFFLAICLGFLSFTMQSLIASLFVFGAIWGAYAPGWGKYFAADGEGPYRRNEQEIWFIDLMVDWIKNDRLAATIGMSLRWFIFFYPLFHLLGSQYLSLGLLLAGPIYYIKGYHHNWVVTEFLSGALLGALLGFINL